MNNSYLSGDAPVLVSKNSYFGILAAALAAGMLAGYFAKFTIKPK